MGALLYSIMGFNIEFNIGFNIAFNIELNIGLNIGLIIELILVSILNSILGSILCSIFGLIMGLNIGFITDEILLSLSLLSGAGMSGYRAIFMSNKTYVRLSLNWLVLDSSLYRQCYRNYFCKI